MTDLTGNIKLADRKKHELKLVGSYVEVFWTATSRLSKRQCEKCVYSVRGQADDMICLELIYDAIDGVHRHDAIYWAPMSAVQYLRVLTEHEAEARIERLEREVLSDMPRD